ncbi:hypothetical protein B0H13DRAFT_1911184 [Mycena leptocephala]|nr:hypothetical protein B0H13DRAFT_1911184 [Mycena leptocephala]
MAHETAAEARRHAQNSRHNGTRNSGHDGTQNGQRRQRHAGMHGTAGMMAHGRTGGTFGAAAGSFPECAALDCMSGTFGWPPRQFNHGTFLPSIENWYLLEGVALPLYHRVPSLAALNGLQGLNNEMGQGGKTIDKK